MPIIITSKKHLFRRLGIAHPAQATEYPDGRFTDAQLEILKADPMLTVEIVKTTESTESTEDKEEALRVENPLSVNSVASVVKKSKKG